jgi:uncharacterized protein YggE
MQHAHTKIVDLKVLAHNREYSLSKEVRTMKQAPGLILAVVCAVFLVGAVGLPTQVEPDPGVITVSGKVVPDEVLITLGVENFHRELSVAKRRNDSNVQEVINITKRYGVAAKDIQTDYISIEPRHEDSYPYTDITGYYVRRTIVVTLRDIDVFEDLLTAVTEAGATNVHGIDFRTSELRKYRDQARALAVQAASEKAEAMAGVLSNSLRRDVAERRAERIRAVRGFRRRIRPWPDLC